MTDLEKDLYVETVLLNFVESNVDAIVECYEDDESAPMDSVELADAIVSYIEREREAMQIVEKALILDKP